MIKPFRITYALLIFALVPSFAISQSNKTLKVQAEMALNEKDWYSAAVFYGKLVARDSSIVSINYGYADASCLNFDLDIAFYWYTKVIAVDNGKKFPLAFHKQILSK